MPRQRLSILVALKDDFERERLTELLSRTASRVMAAPDAAAALKRFRAETPDVTLVDMHMTGPLGKSLVTHMRTESETAPLIVLYDQYNPKQLLEVMEQNADAFLQSPVEPERLLVALRRCARAVFLRRKLEQADHDLRRLLDAFPSMALLENGGRVTYTNRRLANYLGYEDHEAMTADNAAPGDFMERLNGDIYEGGDESWIKTVTDDNLDVDHIIHLENPANPTGRTAAFSVNYSSLPSSELRMFSFHDVSALEDERLRLADEASTDPLTKALNRRSFLATLAQRMAVAGNLSLIMFDIDHFKSINDTFGHDAGDNVLRELAALVRENIRETDALARWGGEEFMVMLPASDYPEQKKPPNGCAKPSVKPSLPTCPDK
nr:diguanylate cyclase [Salidesulfovibrio brasiliensis]